MPYKLKVKIGDWVKISYPEGGYLIGIVSSMTRFEINGEIRHLWVIPKHYEPPGWGWVKDYMHGHYSDGTPWQVSQSNTGTLKVVKLKNKDEVMVEML